VSPTRTVIVGSALPLLILVGLVGFPPARAAVGLERSEPVRQVGSSARSFGINISAPATAGEAIPLGRLRRSIRAGRELAFTGTEIVSAWRPSGASTRVLDLVQRAGGTRTATAHDTADGEPQVTELGSVTDGLAGLSDRALAVLVAGYDLRSAGSGRVAGRSATVVVAARDGREVSRMWLDDRTGLLLRQDVLDSAGRLHRMAAFVDLEVTPAGAEPTAVARSGVATGPLSSPVRVLTWATVAPVPAADPWRDVVSPDELDGMRAKGWPCPLQLPAGFVLLDARRAEVGAGRPAVHLTYGDGLSAISVFLQRGRLDDAAIPGLTRQKWGDADVYVRDGSPEVMVWQGGETVITVVGDATPTDLRTAVSTLPRRSDPGTLGLMQQRMGSALAWFKS
jgi:negative regulator of sigma E activity